MRLTSNKAPEEIRAHLDRSRRALGVTIEMSRAGQGPPHPESAASRRRCRHAATNELCTDIEAADHRAPEIHVPCLRLCTA